MAIVPPSYTVIHPWTMMVKCLKVQINHAVILLQKVWLNCLQKKIKIIENTLLEHQYWHQISYNTKNVKKSIMK